METQKKSKGIAGGLLGLLSLFFLFAMLQPNPAWGNDLVSCRYLKAQGKEILLEIVIGKPAPGVVIVIQNVPASARMVKSSPQVKKYDQATGELKWLLPVTGPGTMQLSMNFDRPMQKTEISGEIRYTDPRTGEMMKMPIKP